MVLVMLNVLLMVVVIVITFVIVVCVVVVVVITYSCVCLLTGVHELTLAVSVMRLVNFFLVYHSDLGSYIIVFEMIVVLVLI
jgi:hypothetical protein